MAQGSHTVFAGYPRVCATCGEKVVMKSIDPLWFETVKGVKLSYHFACYPRQREALAG